MLTGPNPTPNVSTSPAVSTASTASTTGPILDGVPDADVDAAAAIDPRLVVVKRDPLNAEAPLREQIGLITPTSLFYVRSNFTIPRVALPGWRLLVGGAVERNVELTYEQLRALPSRSLLITLECAGNGRSGLRPAAAGEPWQYGAVSTAEWTGVPLGAVLEAAGLLASAREIVVQGADSGTVATRAGVIPFARALNVDKALHPDTLLVYAMNGEVLTTEHGFPLRLIVPGWYGMASVKWITRIDAVIEHFDGYYQSERYIMAHPERGDEANATVPLTAMRVRSLIIDPAPEAQLPRGSYRVRGLAWSGAAPVTRVEVSADDGRSWQQASFASDAQRYAWRRWEYLWEASATRGEGSVGPGQATLRSRAFDDTNQTQPDEPEWNQLGYANNAVQSVAVLVM